MSRGSVSRDIDLRLREGWIASLRHSEHPQSGPILVESPGRPIDAACLSSVSDRNPTSLSLSMAGCGTAT
jgi:hypothetical protein